MKWLERFWFGCGHCHGGESCPFAEQMENMTAPRTGLAALPIPLTAAAVFLLPPAAAIGFGYLAEDLSAGAGVAWQTICGAGGVLLGLAAGAVAAKLLLTGVYRIRTYLNRGSE